LTGSLDEHSGRPFGTDIVRMANGLIRRSAPPAGLVDGPACRSDTLLCRSGTTTSCSPRREDQRDERREVIKAQVRRGGFWAPGVQVARRTSTHQDCKHACSFSLKDVIVDPVAYVGDAVRLDGHLGADSLEEGG
jgi:hypothetical protein